MLYLHYTCAGPVSARVSARLEVDSVRHLHQHARQHIGAGRVLVQRTRVCGGDCVGELGVIQPSVTLRVRTQNVQVRYIYSMCLYLYMYVYVFVQVCM